MGQVFDVRHQAPRARCFGKAEPRPADTFERGFDPLNFLQQFLPAFGLGGAGGTGPKTVDVGLLGSQLLLLPIKCGLGCFALQDFLL